MTQYFSFAQAKEFEKFPGCGFSEVSAVPLAMDKCSFKGIACMRGFFLKLFLLILTSLDTSQYLHNKPSSKFGIHGIACKEV